ncbi:MAG: hypothetical protein KIT84_36410 [Labilithrix sp.]|nr:hypothetical protein [Labilithrix sp.]MCW5816539.1 hypothetical protein [Labilithrix sp.]
MYRINQYSPPPPPRRGWVKAAVLGALGIFLLLVAVSSVAAAAAFRLGARRAAPPAPVASTSPPPLSPPAPEIEPAPLADEPAPALGTPEASLRARPSWGARLERHSGAATKAYAPQSSRPLEAFLAAQPMGDAIDRGFVICRFQSFNKADTFAGDDLHVRATFGATREVAADGPEDGNLGFASAPLVTLQRGDAMRFEVYDRDVFGMTLLSRPSVRWDGGPFNTVDAGAAIECRQLDGAALARAVASEGARADGAVATLAHAKLDGQSPDWGYPAYETSAAHRAIADVAAFTGWADARVTRRITAFDAATAIVDAQRSTVFERLHADARRDATFEDMEVALGDVTCRGDTCTVHLSVTNRSKEALRFGGFFGPRVYVANAGSGPVHASVEATVEPKTTAEIAFDAEVAHGPAIVGVCARGRGYRDRCRPLKVR